MIVGVMLLCAMGTHAQTVDSCAFYKSEYQRLRVKVQLAQQNLFWLNRFVDVVAKNPKQATFVKGWSNRVAAAKLFPASKMPASAPPAKKHTK